MITLHCCGQDYYADEVHAGKKIQCLKCGRLLLIERPGRPPAASRGKAQGTSTAVPTESPNLPSRRRHGHALNTLGICLLILLVGILLYRGPDHVSPPVQSPVGTVGVAANTHPAVGPSALTDHVSLPAPSPAKTVAGALSTLSPVSPTARTVAGASEHVPIATNLAEAREREILEQDAGKLGDPELGKAYQEINQRYFDSRLPKIPVLWETRLGEVGPLIVTDFTLDGLWVHVRDDVFILLNPELKPGPRKLKGVLCHEMVHEYLFTVGDTKTNHGPAFQGILHRLLEEGAFEGIWASESEKVSLRSWLDRESARLDGEKPEIERIEGDIEGEKSELDRIGAEIDHERGDLDREVGQLNERISSTNEQGYGSPSESEIEAVKSRSNLLHKRTADFNSRGYRYNTDCAQFNLRVERDHADVAQFNRQVNRYNLMTSYPDGLDEESLVRPKLAAGRPARAD